MTNSSGIGSMLLWVEGKSYVTFQETSRTVEIHHRPTKSERPPTTQKITLFAMPKAQKVKEPNCEAFCFIMQILAGF